MRLVTFSRDLVTRLGVLEAGEIVDLAAVEPALPSEMCAFLAAGAAAMAAARRASQPRIPVSEVKLEAPILRPPKILAVGLNYADHVAEMGGERPKIT